MIMSRRRRASWSSIDIHVLTEQEEESVLE